MAHSRSRVVVATALLTSLIGTSLVSAGSQPAAFYDQSRLASFQSYELVAQVSIEISGTSGTTLKRTFSYRALVDGDHYRIDARSAGDETPLRQGFSVGFDGASSWIMFPDTGLLTVRAGEIEGPLPVPVPDPIVLQFEAMFALVGQPSPHLSARELSGSRPAILRAMESSATSVRASIATSKASTRIVETRMLADGNEATVILTRESGIWVPVGLKTQTPGTNAAWSEWKTVSFLKPEQSSGVAGVPSLVEFVARDPDQEGLQDLSARIETILFRTLERVSPSEFTFDPDSVQRIWDEDSRMFLKQ